MLETLDSYQKQVIRELEAELAYQRTLWGEEHDMKHSEEEWYGIMETVVSKKRQFRHKMIKLAATAISAVVASDRKEHV